MGGPLTSRSTGGDNSTVKTSLGDNVNLNGGVTAGVVDGAGVDLGDRHDEGLGVWISKLEREQRRRRKSRARYKKNGEGKEKGSGLLLGVH